MSGLLASITMLAVFDIGACLVGLSIR